MFKRLTVTEYPKNYKLEGRRLREGDRMVVKFNDGSEQYATVSISDDEDGDDGDEKLYLVTDAGVRTRAKHGMRYKWAPAGAAPARVTPATPPTTGPSRTTVTTISLPASRIAGLVASSFGVTIPDTATLKVEGGSLVLTFSQTAAL